MAKISQYEGEILWMFAQMPEHQRYGYLRSLAWKLMGDPKEFYKSYHTSRFSRKTKSNQEIYNNVGRFMYIPYVYWAYDSHSRMYEGRESAFKASLKVISKLQAGMDVPEKTTKKWNSDKKKYIYTYGTEEFYLLQSAMDGAENDLKRRRYNYRDYDLKARVIRPKYPSQRDSIIKKLKKKRKDEKLKFEISHSTHLKLPQNQFFIIGKLDVVDPIAKSIQNKIDGG